jgi:hypothetical protein
VKPGYQVCDACKVDQRPRRKDYERRRTLGVYGLTPEAFDELLAGQGGCCAICRTTEAGKKGWCVDHNHATGQVRGLLCASCNLAIGYMADDPARHEAAARYLRGG